MKDHKETIKTIAITILITANVAFLAGVFYNQKQNSYIRNEVQKQVQAFLASDPSTKK